MTAPTTRSNPFGPRREGPATDPPGVGGVAPEAIFPPAPADSARRGAPPTIALSKVSLAPDAYRTASHGSSGPATGSLLGVDEASQPRIPVLAPGVSLLGEYEGSGYVKPHYLARRPDQQMVQLSRLLHLVLSLVDGERDFPAIAAEVAVVLERPVSASNVQYLLDTKLVPLGLAGYGESAPSSRTSCAHQPILTLAVRRTLMSETLVNRFAVVLRWFFLPLVVTEALHGLILVDWWLLTHADLLGAIIEVAQQPTLMLAILGLTLLSMVVHELGHASACRYGGGRPGHIGAGLYVVWPALYTNVTDAYRLNRVGRLRTDLGGVYFNVLFILGAAGAYGLTGWKPLILVIMMGHAEILQQLLPVVRLDGYFILGDMVGVPDLFGYMKPILQGLVPGRPVGEKALSLTRRARVIVRIWVLITLVLIMGNLALMIFRAPQMVPVFWASIVDHLLAFRTAAEALDPVALVLDLVSLVMLSLPTVGMWIVLLRTARLVLRPVFARAQARQRVVGRHLVR